MARLILMCGLPGSGKTTQARALELQLVAHRLSPDEWLSARGLAGTDEAARAEIELEQWARAQELLAMGETVILESGFWSANERAEKREAARALGAEVELQYLAVPIDELAARLEERNADLPPGSFAVEPAELEEWAARFAAPSAEELATFDAPTELVEAFRRLSSVGAEARDWLQRVPALLDDVADEWELTVGPCVGGNWGLVFAVTDADGFPRVLKLAAPQLLEGQKGFAVELAGLQRANGHGYARVFQADPSRDAVLMERLGGPLCESGLSLAAQVDAVAAATSAAWRASEVGDVRLQTGAEQVREVAEHTVELARDFPDAVSPEVLARAAEYAETRAAALDARLEAGAGVVIHGDANPTNLLAADDGTYRLIDPSPMLSEPEHDLAIALCNYSAELLAYDDPAGQLWALCARAARQTGTDVEAIWEWAFIERVSTGLFMLSLGIDEGRELLAVAERIVTDGIGRPHQHQR